MTVSKSTMMFNERVLELGKVEQSAIYDLKMIDKKLFFNKVFSSNMNELFQREDCDDITDDYHRALREYNRNLDMIVDWLNVNVPQLRIDVADTFERRLTTKLRCEDQLISLYTDMSKLVNFSFIHNQIYFLTPTDDYGILITTIDPKQSIYASPLSYGFKHYEKFWLTCESVRSYIQDGFGQTVAIRTTCDRHGKLVKVNFSGDTGLVRDISKFFPSNVVLFKDKYLYLGDLDQIISQLTERNKRPDHYLLGEYEKFTLDSIFNQDVLIEYPTTSFDIYLRLLHLASVDTRVQRISLCLYRMGDNPIIYYILRDAVRRGVDVTVNIETEASGEEINRYWLRELKRVGINVLTYGTGFLKVHCKITLIEFFDGETITQVGTGNYHWETTSQYTDLSYVTGDKKIGESAKKLFALMSQESKSPRTSFGNHFLVSRHNARRRLTTLIKAQGKLGEAGYIAIKCNSFDDPEIATTLAEAASNGCRVILIVRGICTWTPEEYLGKNVMIQSYVWDKLEHSRVYCFGTKDPVVYVGSLDLTTKKLDERIETLVQLPDPHVRKAACDYLSRYILNSQNLPCWEMLPDGSYQRIDRGN